MWVDKNDTMRCALIRPLIFLQINVCNVNLAYSHSFTEKTRYHGTDADVDHVKLNAEMNYNFSVAKPQRRDI